MLVVSVVLTGVYGYGRWFVDDEEVGVLVNDLHLLCGDGRLVAVKGMANDIRRGDDGLHTGRPTIDSHQTMGEGPVVVPPILMKELSGQHLEQRTAIPALLRIDHVSEGIREDVTKTSTQHKHRTNTAQTLAQGRDGGREQRKRRKRTGEGRTDGKERRREGEKGREAQGKEEQQRKEEGRRTRGRRERPERGWTSPPPRRLRVPSQSWMSLAVTVRRMSEEGGRRKGSQRREEGVGGPKERRKEQKGGEDEVPRRRLLIALSDTPMNSLPWR